jgi:DNA replication protein DnaC
LVRQLFTLDFMREHANVVFIGNVGLGKTHLAAALCVQACEQRKHARFITAAELINELEAARAGGYLGKALRQYHRVDLLAIDELGFLPVDKRGAELLFQVLAGRYEHASTVITTNRVYKEWSATFANDSAMTAAVLDRVIHHCYTVRITGKSRRRDEAAKQEV